MCEWQTIVEEAAKGNFSFFILVVGVIQTALMIWTLTLSIKNHNKNKETNDNGKSDSTH